MPIKDWHSRPLQGIVFVCLMVAKMLKAVYTQKNKRAARQKIKAVVEELRSMKIKEVIKNVGMILSKLLLIAIFPANTGVVSILTI